MKINTLNSLKIPLIKGNVQDLITEGMGNEEFRKGLKRLLTPLIQDKFPDYPTYEKRTVTEVNEDGTAIVELRVVKPRAKAKVETPVNPNDKPGIPNNTPVTLNGTSLPNG